MSAQSKYLKLEAPVGTARFSLREPSVFTAAALKPHTPGETCDTVKYNAEYCGLTNETTIPVGEVPYCGQNKNCNGECKKCVIWDAIEDKNVQDKSVLVTTHIQAVTQTRARCSETPENDTICPRAWVNNDDPVDNFIASIENFTVLVDHSFTTPSQGISKTAKEMSGVLLSSSRSFCAKFPRCTTTKTEGCIAGTTDDGGCKVSPQLSKRLAYFKVQDLLDSAALNLEDEDSGTGHSYRYMGVVAALNIRYVNWEVTYRACDRLQATFHATYDD